jgi:hypothetical protein
MKFFYLSTKCNSAGKFEIHERNCKHIPPILDREYLGPFNNGKEALRRACNLNPNALLCTDCCVYKLEDSEISSSGIKVD